MQELSTLAELAPQVAVAAAVIGLVFFLRRGDMQRLKELKSMLPNGSSERRMQAIEDDVSAIKTQVAVVHNDMKWLRKEYAANSIRPGDAE